MLSLQSVGKLSRGCVEATWRVWGGLWMVRGGYIEGVERLPGRCGNAVWRVREAVPSGCGEVVGLRRLLRGY